eukprot:3901954-Rhodomonas_salina.4
MELELKFLLTLFVNAAYDEELRRELETSCDLPSDYTLRIQQGSLQKARDCQYPDLDVPAKLVTVWIS